MQHFTESERCYGVHLMALGDGVPISIQEDEDGDLRFSINEGWLSLGTHIPRQEGKRLRDYLVALYADDGERNDK